MAAATEVDRRYEIRPIGTQLLVSWATTALATSHVPMLATPDDLANVLLGQ